MTWVRLDDNMPDHPKVAPLSDAAFRLFVEGLCYCARYLTDGYISREAFLKMTALVPRTSRKRSADALVSGTLWERSGNGYQVCNYTDWNPSKATIEAIREAKSEAGKKGAEARYGDGTSHAAAITIPSPTQGSTPNPAERGTRENGKNPRATGTNPRARAANEKRARSVATCKRECDERIGDGERFDAVIDQLFWEYRHDKSIVTEAIPEAREAV